MLCPGIISLTTKKLSESSSIVHGKKYFNSSNMTYTTGLLGSALSECVLTAMAEDIFNESLSVTKYYFSKSASSIISNYKLYLLHVHV